MEDKRFKTLILIFFLVAVVHYLSGQSGTAVIVYGEGDGFTLVRKGVSDFFEVDYDDILGMLLYSGDTILTEGDTFLEIQVTSNASLIKIAENTSFTFEEIGQFGGSSLKVVYGRIRAKVNRLTNNDEFTVTGSGTVAGVRGTDFGYDLTFGPDLSTGRSNEVIISIYCFEGSVKVEQKKSATAEIKEVLIGPNQMVVTSSVKQDAPLLVYKIEEEIDQFWEDNKFVYEMPEEDVLIVSENYKSDDDYSAIVFGHKRRLKRTASGFVLLSMLSGVGGGVALSLMDDNALGAGLLSLAGASFIAGNIILSQINTLPDPPAGWVAPPVAAEISGKPEE